LVVILRRVGRCVAGMVVGYLAGLLLIATLPFLSLAGLIGRDRDRMLSIAYVMGSITVMLGGTLGFRSALAEEQKAAEEVRNREAADAAKRVAEERRRRDDLQRQIFALRQLCFEAQSEALTLATTVAAADADLSEAEAELAKPRYSPFWESLESAAGNLTRFDVSVRMLVDLKSQHERSNQALGGAAPEFSLGNTIIPDPAAISRRLRMLYLRAQEDSSFAIVYEQRRTVTQMERMNSVLSAGFASLHDAVQGLGDRVTDALERLRATVSIEVGNLHTSLESTAAIAAEQRRMFLAEIEQVEYAGENIVRQIREQIDNRLAHERVARRMLDNIQRGRKPGVLDQDGA
jgi:hypothetical protein